MAVFDSYGGNAPGKVSLVMLTLFTLSLAQFSVDIGGDGVSANYIYVLIPFVFWFFGIRRRVVRRDEVMLILLFYTFIYLLGVPGDIADFDGNDRSGVRRLASFLIFIFPLLLSFVEFRPEDARTFKLAVVIASVAYSLMSIVIIALHRGGPSLLDISNETRSQRYGFILCLGFFIALFEQRLLLDGWKTLQRIVVCSIIFLGMILTFSRSTLVAIAAAAVFFWISRQFFNKSAARVRRDGRKQGVRIAVICVLVGCVFVIFENTVGLDLLVFYKQRFIDPLLNSTLLVNTLDRPETSEGHRYYVFLNVANYLTAHPFFGSNFRGLFLVFDENELGGSAHNQYIDVFLRTGFIGAAVWLFIVYRVYQYCRKDPGLQTGLIAILFYGFFHETFKESHGSFVLAMLLSFSYAAAAATRRRRGASANRSNTGSGPGPDKGLPGRN